MSYKLRYLGSFLKIFDLILDSKSLEILDDKSTVLGHASYDGKGNIHVKCKIQDSLLSAIIFYNQNNFFIDCDINNNIIDGHMSLRINGEYGNRFKQYNIAIFDKEVRILKCRYNGKTGEYYSEVCIDGQRVEMGNKQFVHYYDYDFSMVKVYMNGNRVNYEREETFGDDIYGCYNSSPKNFDDETKKVISEIDDNYYYFIDDINDYFARFYNKLYTNIVNDVYKPKYEHRIELTSSNARKLVLHPQKLD